jgi:hypothetical protein
MNSFRRIVISLLAASLVIIGINDRASANLVHGTVDLVGIGGFDFSDQKVYPPPVTDYPIDISFAIVVDPPLGPRLVAWHGYILAVPDSLVENITTAPEDASAYHLDEIPVYNRAYVFKTEDGFYAKFAVRSELSGNMIIEYFVQTDGTNVLVDPTPTQATTWGRVKALYVPRR